MEPRRGEKLAGAFTVVSLGEAGESGCAGLGLACVNNVSVFWGVGAARSLVPGLALAK